MQSRASVCSPQTLIRLQNIFDAAWLQLTQKKRQAQLSLGDGG